MPGKVSPDRRNYLVTPHRTSKIEAIDQQGDPMNRDQVEGKAKDIAGKIQQKTGEITGSATQQIKGVGKQIEGKVQKGIGDAQQAGEDAAKRSR